MIVFEGVKTKGHTVVIAIGKSSNNQKCVRVPTDVVCDSRAGDRGIRLNTDWRFAPDRFNISVNDHDKRLVCAKRLDTRGKWYMHLTIRCEALKCKSYRPFNIIVPSGYKLGLRGRGKCNPNVHYRKKSKNYWYSCASDATKDWERSVPYPDTFNVVTGSRNENNWWIRRTDKCVPWGAKPVMSCSECVLP